MIKYLSTLLVAITLLTTLSCKHKTDNNAAAASKNDSIPAPVRDITIKIKGDPDNADLYHQRAKIYIEIQKPGLAVLDMQKVISLDTSKPEYFVTLADLYFMTGKASASKSALQKCISLDPKNVDANLKLAELDYLLRNYKVAIDKINKILEEHGDNANAYMIKGRALKEMGDTTKAVDNFRKAILYNPKYFDAYIQLGILFASKKNPMALDYYNNALNIKPNSPEAFYNIGMFHQETGDLEKAKESYNAIITINPKGSDEAFLKMAFHNLGYILLVYKNKPDQAIIQFNNAIKTDSVYVEAYYNRGLSYEKMNNFAKAQSDYKAALAIKPDFEKSRLGLERTDQKLRKPKK